MPHTRSAKKRLRQSEKRRLSNRATLKAIKTQLKKVQAAASAGNADQLRAEATLAIQKLDRAAAKHVLHRNNVARKKSQVTKLLHRAVTGGAPPAK
jgi:small subunit ribosomal protein S20